MRVVRAGNSICLSSMAPPSKLGAFCEGQVGLSSRVTTTLLSERHRLGLGFVSMVSIQTSWFYFEMQNPKVKVTCWLLISLDTFRPKSSLCLKNRGFELQAVLSQAVAIKEVDRGTRGHRVLERSPHPPGLT